MKASSAVRDHRPAAPDDPFADLHPPLGAAAAVVEASRCLYCHDAPCIRACPTGIDIPTFIHQIRTDNLEGSALTILDANIMGGTCARACPTEILCEQACVLNGAEDKAIEIGRLQRHAVDHLLAAGKPHPFIRAAASGKRLAVVGAGPAGLAFAHRAAMLGHEVTVFEGRPKPGGLNEYGLAAYKMVDDFAQAEVDFLLGVGGIRVELGKRLGAGLTIDGLRHDHDAVFLAVGLDAAPGLGIPGEGDRRVRDAIDFIAELRQTEPKSRMKVAREAVVIGGGNTAIDAAIQAKKLGAAMVTLVYRRGRAQMGATAREQDLALRNGVILREWARPIAIEEAGKGLDVVFEETRLDGGRVIGTGATFRLAAGLVLKAIGQTMLPRGLEGVDLERGRIRVDADYRTSLEDVFAGGDCIGSTVDLTVQAVEDGKRAAHAVDAWLRGDGGGI